MLAGILDMVSAQHFPRGTMIVAIITGPAEDY
jgi:hypothetical protein